MKILKLPYESMAVISSKKVASCLNCILFFFFFSLYVGFMKLFTFLNFVGTVCYLNPCTYRREAVATGQVLFHHFYCKKSFDCFNVKVKFCLLSFSLYIENKCRKEKFSLKCIHDVLIVGIMVKFTVSYYIVEVFGTI